MTQLMLESLSSESYSFMRLKAIITYKTSRSREVSIWKTQGHSEDHASFAAEAIAELKKRQRRQLTVVAVMVHAASGA